MAEIATVRRPGAGRRTRVGRSAAFGLVAFAFVVTMLGTTLPTPLYPLYQERFGFGNLMVTVVYATYAGGVIAALVALGRLSDRIGRRPVLLLSLALSAASGLVFLFAGGVAGLLAGRGLSGLAAGIMTGTATAALVDLAPPHRPGRASLVAAAANMGGLGLGPLLAGGLAAYAPRPTTLCFVVSVALVAAAAVGVAALPRVPGVPAAGAAARAGADRLPGRLPGRHPGTPPGRHPGPSPGRRPRVPAGMRGTFLAAAVPGFAGFAVLGLFAAVAGPLLGAVVQRTDHLLTGALAATGFAASLAGQALSAATSERRAMRHGCLLLAAGAGLVAASLAVTSLPLLVVAAVAAGVGQGLSFRAGLAMLAAASPPGERAAVASSYFTTLYIALSIPVIGCGAGAQSVGWVRSATIFCAAVGALPLIVLAGQLLGGLRRAARRRAVPRPAAPVRVRPETRVGAGPLTEAEAFLAVSWERRDTQGPQVWLPPQRAASPAGAPIPLPGHPPLALSAPRVVEPELPAVPRPRPVVSRDPAEAATLPPPWDLPPGFDPAWHDGPARLPHPWRLPPQPARRPTAEPDARPGAKAAPEPGAIAVPEPAPPPTREHAGRPPVTPLG